ncbi:hypothetical protein D3C77_248730 [compost metagenome]
MINIKMLKGTGPYNQMKRHIEEVHKDLTPQQRAGKFTALLKAFLRNRGAFNKDGGVPPNLMRSFVWLHTPEGGDFWRVVNQQRTAPILKEKPLKPAPIVEQPQVVWPEGFIYYNPRLLGGKGAFLNEEGRVNPQGNLVGWNNPKEAFEYWKDRLDTIKRPETPLPGGRQWKGDYTHYNPIAGGFQFNKTHLAQGVLHKAWIGDNGDYWLGHENTIKRYPDNQPLALGAPVAAPEAVAQRVEARVPPAPPVVAQVVVEAPKVEPIKHKPVGWWT